MDKRDKGGARATSSPMELGGSRDIDEGNSSMRTGETLLRLMPVALCMVALVVMLKNSETNDFGSLTYSDLGAFRYLVHANGICAGFSLLSAIFTAIPRPFTMPRAWTFFFLDQVLTYVILVAGVASTDVLYLAYKGDTSVTWSEACGTYGGFCKKAVASVAMTFVTVTCYAAISVLSSYKLFSKFDAPVNYRDKGIEIPVFQG